jgi:hypothetical protein
MHFIIIFNSKFKDMIQIRHFSLGLCKFDGVVFTKVKTPLNLGILRPSLPGDGRRQNDLWGVVNSALQKKLPPNPFYSLPIAKYCPHIPSNAIKPWENHSCCSEIHHLCHAK